MLMNAAPPAGLDNDQPPAELLAAAQDLARQFIALGYHAAYGDRFGVEIRHDDASAILAILQEHAAQHHTPGTVVAALARLLVTQVRNLPDERRQAEQDTYPVQIAIAIIDGDITSISDKGRTLLADKIAQLTASYGRLRP
jgi:hypothetical protein